LLLAKFVRPAGSELSNGRGGIFTFKLIQWKKGGGKRTVSGSIGGSSFITKDDGQENFRTKKGERVQMGLAQVNQGDERGDPDGKGPGSKRGMPYEIKALHKETRVKKKC